MADSHPAPAVRARVLIVEDEPKTRASIAEAIRLEGWEASEASRGREMIALLDQREFDLVVLDWMLPGRDGLELLQHVRARGTNIPVLMLTARSDIDDRVIGLESGADDYLAKPFAMAELSARCRALLRRQSAISSLMFVPVRQGAVKRRFRSHQRRWTSSNTCSRIRAIR
jgi:DNA-binding response OmpR family regulator